MEFPLCNSSNLWYLRLGTTKALICGFGERLYVVKSAYGGLTGGKALLSVSVSHSKVLLFLVVDCDWKYGV
jgi:hypothetical protein